MKKKSGPTTKKGPRPHPSQNKPGIWEKASNEDTDAEFLFVKT